jgi:hypothetical protein
MAVTTNTTLTSDITIRAKEVDFVSRFSKTWDALIEIMGIARPVRKTLGTQLVASKAEVTLQDGAIAEGD